MVWPVCALVVTGGAGYLGQRVVGLLASRRDAGRIVSIDLQPAPDAPARVDQVVVDLTQDTVARLAETIAGASSVIHLAWTGGTVERSGGSGGRTTGSALVALRRVLDAAEATQATQVVHVSSATVYGAWPDNPIPIPEDAPIRPNPGFQYSVEKAEAERILAEWAEDHPEAAVAVLRPAVTVGADEPARYQALAGTRAPRPDDA